MEVARALIVDTDVEMYDLSVTEWAKYSVETSRVDNLPLALAELALRPYHLVVIVENKSMRDEILRSLDLLMNLTDAPIILASIDAITAEYRIRAHDSGVVDVWEMPPTIREAVAKGSAMVRRYMSRRQSSRQTTIIIHHPIVMCVEYRLVLVNGQPVDLIRKEFDILRMLMAYPRRVFTHEQILIEVWGDEYNDNTVNTVWTHITRLRQSLNVRNDLPDFIKTHRGVGYSFDP